MSSRSFKTSLQIVYTPNLHSFLCALLGFFMKVVQCWKVWEDFFLYLASFSEETEETHFFVLSDALLSNHSTVQFDNTITKLNGIFAKLLVTVWPQWQIKDVKGLGSSGKDQSSNPRQSTWDKATLCLHVVWAASLHQYTWHTGSQLWNLIREQHPLLDSENNDPSQPLHMFKFSSMGQTRISWNQKWSQKWKSTTTYHHLANSKPW